jgi:hypothetical protein
VNRGCGDISGVIAPLLEGAEVSDEGPDRRQRVADALTGGRRIRFTSKPSASHSLPRSPWERRSGRHASLALSLGQRGASKTAFPRSAWERVFRKVNQNPGHVLSRGSRRRLHQCADARNTRKTCHSVPLLGAQVVTTRCHTSWHEKPPTELPHLSLIVHYHRWLTMAPDPHDLA